MKPNWAIETQTILNPIHTKTKIAFVPAIFTVDQVTQTVLDNPAPNSDQPNKCNTDTKYQARNTLTISQVGAFQVKAMPFHKSMTEAKVIRSICSLPFKTHK